MPIKAISLDFWNTLYYDHQVMYERHDKRVNRLKEALEKNGYDSQLDVEGSFQYCWEYFDKKWKDEQKTMNARELLLIGCNWLKITLPEEDIISVSKYYEEILLENPPVLFDGAKDTVVELAKTFKLGITSDTAYTPGRILRKLLEKDDLLKYFTAFSYSDEIGHSKPHIDTFNSTIKQLGVEPDETVHVGDNEFTDVSGAVAAGMKSIIFMGAIEREVSFTDADYVANDWEELRKLLLNINSQTD